MKSSVIYQGDPIKAHGSEAATVYLMNEAPGPCEMKHGVPCYGLQGANLFHALRLAEIPWAVQHAKFSWPQNDSAKGHERQERKRAFLMERARRITCSNAYCLLPVPANGSKSFCPPDRADVLSDDNLLRVRREVHANHRILLICGESAYLACTGRSRLLSVVERTEICPDTLAAVNDRLGGRSFSHGWYMGHTRRWLMNGENLRLTLARIGREAGWLQGASVDDMSN